MSDAPPPPDADPAGGAPGGPAPWGAPPPPPSPWGAPPPPPGAMVPPHGPGGHAPPPFSAGGYGVAGPHPGGAYGAAGPHPGGAYGAAGPYPGGAYGAAGPYPGGAYGIAVGPPPERPASLAQAVLLMRIGGVLAALGLLLVLGLRSELEQAVRDTGAFTSEADIDAAVTLGIGMSLLSGLLGAGLWFWMAWANGQGRSWARVTASVFFGFSVLGLVSTLVQPGAAISKLLTVVQFGVGLAAIVLLYRPESSRYFDARSRP